MNSNSHILFAHGLFNILLMLNVQISPMNGFCVSVHSCPDEQEWLPCWNGCDPQQLACGEHYSTCERVVPEPCIGRCICSIFTDSRSTLFSSFNF